MSIPGNQPAPAPARPRHEAPTRQEVKGLLRFAVEMTSADASCVWAKTRWHACEWGQHVSGMDGVVYAVRLTACQRPMPYDRIYRETERAS